MTFVNQQNDEIMQEFDPYSEPMKPILDNLQANILMSHGRDQACHVFLRFKDREKAKRWISDHTQDPYSQEPFPQVTSAFKQLDDAVQRCKDSSYSGNLLTCFFLSAAGYMELLGYNEKQLRELFPDTSFVNGMKTHKDYYYWKNGQQFSISNKDPLPKDWQRSYRSKIHAMLLMAWNDEISLEHINELLKDSLNDVADVVGIEYGRQLSGKIEPFGFLDGISNPSFFSKRTKTTDCNSKFYLSLAKNLVLVRDPLAREADSYGSYFVFRKLEQDKQAFDVLGEKLLADYKVEGVQLSPGDQIIGRSRNGTPLIEFAQTPGPEGDPTYFTFGDDKDGLRCPFSAHIRKANPRDGNERRIVRRGIPYNEIETHTGSGLGMLFMCYQRSIYHQFEFIQRVWIDNRNHPIDNTGVDSLAGQDWSEENNYKRPVTLKGGEYFFAPSLSFLRTIGMSEQSA